MSSVSLEKFGHLLEPCNFAAEGIAVRVYDENGFHGGFLCVGDLFVVLDRNEEHHVTNIILHGEKRSVMTSFLSQSEKEGKLRRVF